MLYQQIIYSHFCELFSLFHRAWEVFLEIVVHFNGAKY